MALMERLLAAMRVFVAPPAEKTAATQVAWNQIFTTGLDRFFGPGTLTQPFAQHPTIHAAVEAISSSISSLELEMFPESDERREAPIKGSIVGDLLRNPGPDMDGPQLIEGTIDFMKLEGEAFWFLDSYARRTALGPKYPTRIDLWEPHNVRTITENGRISGWEYQSAGDIFRTSADRVIQFKHFNPYDPFRGLAPLTAAIVAARGGYKALQYQDSFFDNNAVPYGILMPVPGSIIQQDAMLRMRDELEARQMGPTKHGRIGALNTSVDFKELGMSHKDMDFPVWLDAASAFILMVFKVPPSVAGLQKDANYNASIQQAKQFWYNHLPLARYIERRIRLRLCKQFGISEVPYFKTEALKALTEDQESLSNQARNYFNMGVPFKDINDRLELGFPADSIAAETPWLPFSLVNADEQAMAPAMEEIGGPDRQPRPAEEQNQPGDEATQQQPKSKQLFVSPEGRELHRRLSWRTLISKIRDEEMFYQKSIRDHFWRLKNEVLSNLRARKAIKVLEVRFIMFDTDRAADDLEKKVEPIYKAAITRGAESVIAELQLEGTFDLLTPEVQTFLQQKMFEIADLIDKPLEQRLRAALQEGVSAGESVEKIADRVEEVFDIERSRARRIARTEVAEAFNGGRYATMKEAGVHEIEWLTARDARVRDSHERIDGEKVAVGERFSNGLLYPLDPGGPPEEIVNCRCVSAPVA